MGVLAGHTVTPDMLDRLATERYSHEGETHAELMIRLERTERPGSAHDTALRISIGHAAEALARKTKTAS